MPEPQGRVSEDEIAARACPQIDKLAGPILRDVRAVLVRHGLDLTEHGGMNWETVRVGLWGMAAGTWGAELRGEEIRKVVEGGA